MTPQLILFTKSSRYWHTNPPSKKKNKLSNMAPSLSKNAIDVIDPIDQENLLSITLEGSNFLVNGHPILTEVPSNIVATTCASTITSTTKSKNMAMGCFVGFNATEHKSRHVAPLGKLSSIKFMSIFRFKVWWATHWIGDIGRDVEHETQLIILDKNDIGRPYVLLLPILEGPFRVSLQPGIDDYVDMCVESGSTRVCSSSFTSCLYMHVGYDPYNLVKEAVKVIRDHLGTFKLLEEKNPPSIVDKFGWCTWDAFYLQVHPKGIWEGVKGLVEGGCPPGLVLIDDGWQTICHDDDDPKTQEGMNRTYSSGEQMPCRLTRFEENCRFRNYQSFKGQSHDKGMGAFVRDLKDEFRTIEHVYVWHALCGYWGGIRPNIAEGHMPLSRVIKPKRSEGLKMTMKDLSVDRIVENGIGLVQPEMVLDMYNGLHSHLQSMGINGVKVDVIHLLEMLCEEFGGRVELAKAYYKALSASVNKHFKGNGVIASMEQCNDFMYLGTEAISLGRVGDDFWCTDPNGDPNGMFWLQGCHMVHCAYNSLWMGNFIHPDWDMFQSTHPCAMFHAASRAISGGPIYASDSVGKHNFELLRRLALPDGSIMRCQHYALPTRDCLFEDPLHDGKTVLKIWNLNKYSGVLGAFNCQGGGWNPKSRRVESASKFLVTLSCMASPRDIEWGSGDNLILVEEESIFAVYFYQRKKLAFLKLSDTLELLVEPLDYELLTVSPVTILAGKFIQFALIGLVNMLNTGGAIQSLEIEDDKNLVRVGVKGCGEMRIFASEMPTLCKIDGEAAEFEYRDQMVIVSIPWPGSSRLTMIEYRF